MCLFAAWTSTGPRKALAVFKHIAALKASAGQYGQLFALGRNRTGHMREVVENLFFPDSHLPGYFPGIHFSFTQKRNYFLAYGLRS